MTLLEQMSAPTEALGDAAFHLHSLRAVQSDIVQALRTLYHLGQLEEQCVAYETPLPFSKCDLDRVAGELVRWAGEVVASQDGLRGEGA